MNNRLTGDIVQIPAPWTLNGTTAYLFWHTSRPACEQFNECVESERTPFRAGAGGLLLVRYADSPVGPYDELLLIPGSYQVANETFFRITQIYVSSMESVINGRRNWAVPKKLARFEWTDNDQTVKIFLPEQSQPFCSIRLRRRLYCFPASSSLVPARLRTLVQPPLDEHDKSAGFFRITLACSGWFRPWVQLLEFQTDGKEMPSAEQLPLYSFGVGYEAFTLVFPVPELMRV
jgi:hypothetical protein